MGFRVGDAVFDRNGRPGVVAKQDPDSREFTVDRNEETVKKHHGHGYINGLEQNERSEYSQVMSEVRSVKDPTERIGFLQEKVNELRTDPSQQKMVSYLEAELFHVMSTHGVRPKTYQISSTEKS